MSACTTEDATPTTVPTPLPPIVVDIGMTANTVMAPVDIEFEAKGFTDGAGVFLGFRGWQFSSRNIGEAYVSRCRNVHRQTFGHHAKASLFRRSPR